MEYNLPFFPSLFLSFCIYYKYLSKSIIMNFIPLNHFYYSLYGYCEIDINLFSNCPHPKVNWLYPSREKDIPIFWHINPGIGNPSKIRQHKLWKNLYSCHFNYKKIDDSQVYCSLVGFFFFKWIAYSCSSVNFLIWFEKFF